jgi:hypothetical protein
MSDPGIALFQTKWTVNGIIPGEIRSRRAILAGISLRRTILTGPIRSGPIRLRTPEIVNRETGEMRGIMTLDLARDHPISHEIIIDLIMTTDSLKDIISEDIIRIKTHTPLPFSQSSAFKNVFQLPLTKH